MFSNGFVHTNNIESFWATLKRGVYGIYHHVSLKYLQRYVDEFCFRYNNRKENTFKMVLKQAVIEHLRELKAEYRDMWLNSLWVFGSGIITGIILKCLLEPHPLECILKLFQ